MSAIELRIVDRSAINALARLQATAPSAVSRGLLRFGLAVGSAVASRAPRKSRRLARSFLTPQLSGNTVLLGRGVPIYGAIHEYGGDIVPRNGDYLTFQVGGQWVRTKKVHIREKRYARGGIAATASRGPAIIGAEIAKGFAV